MFAVENILVSDDLLDAPFACNLGACQGACCVQGDSGAPLEREELAALEAVLPRVRKYLRPEALRLIEAEGAWEEVEPGCFATRCVGDAECVFVMYEGPVAKCAIQKAYNEGRVAFPKPISCHLYPLRIQQAGEYEIVNYEQISLCDAARRAGGRQGIQLSDYLREPLVRKYGAAWYEQFVEILSARRELLARGDGCAAHAEEDRHA